MTDAQLEPITCGNCDKLAAVNGRPYCKVYGFSPAEDRTECELHLAVRRQAAEIKELKEKLAWADYILAGGGKGPAHL